MSQNMFSFVYGENLEHEKNRIYSIPVAQMDFEGICIKQIANSTVQCKQC